MKRVKEIVMDGTATGILDKLPKFDRPYEHIPAALDTARAQFIFGHQKVRAFFGDLFREAALEPTRDKFFINAVCLTTAELVKKSIFPDDQSDSLFQLLLSPTFWL